MHTAKHKETDSKQPDEYVEPASITLDHFNHRNKAFNDSICIEKIWEDPNMIIEDGTNYVHYKSNYNYSHNKY